MHWLMFLGLATCAGAACAEIPDGSRGAVSEAVRPAAGGGDGAASGRLTQLLSGLESLEAGFSQVVRDETGRIVERSDGTFAMAAPDRFRWHYRTPYEQVIVADGKRVWLHDVDLEQVTVRDQAEAAAGSPLYVLARPATLAERFAVETVEAGDGEDAIALEPLVPGADFERVTLRFVGSELSELVIQDAFGQRTGIRFEGLRRNVPVPAGVFEFRPPAGIDVVGLESLLGEPARRDGR